MPVPAWLIAFVTALIVGTLVEYWVHRAMHHTFFLRKRHTLHHKGGEGQGWLGEFRDYFLGSVLLYPLGLLISIEFEIGWVAGGLVYACWAAYSHQLQHERPELCFWLPRPVHHIHHAQHMWRHNFGISFDIWDRVFGTYKKVEWQRGCRLRDVPVWRYFQIRWI